MSRTGSFDTDLLPPTQYLVLEVLAARHRLGETSWTFPKTVSQALLALQSAGLVDVFGNSRPKVVEVRLTDTGRSAAMGSDYQPPNGGVEQLRMALTAIAEFAEERRDLAVGMTAVAHIARQALLRRKPDAV